MAAQNSQTKIIKCLLFHRADPNARDLVIYLNFALKEFRFILSMEDHLFFIV